VDARFDDDGSGRRERGGGATRQAQVDPDADDGVAARQSPAHVDAGEGPGPSSCPFAGARGMSAKTRKVMPSAKQSMIRRDDGNSGVMKAEDGEHGRERRRGPATRG